MPGIALIVQLSTHTYGRVFVTDIYDDYKPDPLEGSPALTNSSFSPILILLFRILDFQEGQYVQCFVLNSDSTNKYIDLSLRPSRVCKVNVPAEVI